MLEGWFLAPQIQGNSNDFTNSGTLIILAIGGALAGGLGVVFALPAAGLVRALTVYTFLRLQGHDPEGAINGLRIFREEAHKLRRNNRPDDDPGTALPPA